MSARITILNGEETGKILDLPQRPLTLGRDDSCDIRIQHPSISKVHAHLELRGTQLVATDCDSTNGLRHAGQRQRLCLISDQEVFSCGDILLRFSSGQHSAELLLDFARRSQALTQELSRRIVGQQLVLRELVASIFAGGHTLLVGVPGLAKTAIVTSLAQTLDLSFKRIQFTPDLLPSDITGTTVLEEDAEGRRSFRFVAGPVFTQLLLADEINRTPPKTQAALLEAMQEGQVTAGESSLPLPRPFIVIATQNPIEQEGTYPLPEAQLDRFMFNIRLAYPDRAEEEEILRRTTGLPELPLHRIFKAAEILLFQNAIAQMTVPPAAIAAAAALTRATRPEAAECPAQLKPLIEYGAGPRAGQFLIRAAKAFAAMDGRSTLTPEDICAAAVPVLRHRIAPSFQARAAGLDSVKLITRLLELAPLKDGPSFR